MKYSATAIRSFDVRPEPLAKSGKSVHTRATYRIASHRLRTVVQEYKHTELSASPLKPTYVVDRPTIAATDRLIPLSAVMAKGALVASSITAVCLVATFASGVTFIHPLLALLIFVASGGFALMSRQTPGS